jgi:hypothetical protein
MRNAIIFLLARHHQSIRYRSMGVLVIGDQSKRHSHHGVKTGDTA